MGTWENRFQNSDKLRTCKTSSSLSFHQYFQVFNMSFKVHFWHFVLLEMISFEKIVKTVVQKFAVQCKYHRYKDFARLVLEFVVDSFVLRFIFTKTPERNFTGYKSDISDNVSLNPMQTTCSYTAMLTILVILKLGNWLSLWLSFLSLFSLRSLGLQVQERQMLLYRSFPTFITTFQSKERCWWLILIRSSLVRSSSVMAVTIVTWRNMLQMILQCWPL